MGVGKMNERTFPEMVICPLNKASKFLMSSSSGPTFTSLISIGDPGSKFPAGSSRVRPQLRLEFHDVIRDDSARGFFPPKKEDVEHIINFGKMLNGKSGKVLIHCFAGVSRSTAAGFILNAIFLGAGFEAEAIKLTCNAATEREKGICPNELMVKMADDLLGRSGAMYFAWNEAFVIGSSSMYG